MRFIYRGVYYDQQVSSSLELTEGKAGGHYRGAVWRCRTLASQPIARIPRSTPSKLTYRGTAYSPNTPIDDNGADSAAGVTPPTLLHERCPKMLPSLLPQVERLHHSNICRNIEHRLAVAKAQGNDALVSLLEREFETTLCKSGYQVHR
jgi:hypothetical protein